MGVDDHSYLFKAIVPSIPHGFLGHTTWILRELVGPVGVLDLDTLRICWFGSESSIELALLHMMNNINHDVMTVLLQKLAIVFRTLFCEQGLDVQV